MSGGRASLDRAIFDALGELEDQLFATLAEAVRTPSIAPRYPGVDYDAVVGGEGKVARIVARVYAEAGCEVDLFAQEPGRENCVGVLRGAGGGRSLAFNGHTDVVPPGPSAEWSDDDPWSGRIAEGRLWGRGACDMKAGVVAAAFAVLALRRAGVDLRGDVILHAVVGEEMMEHELGTTACLRRGYGADAAVVAEPTAPPTRLAVAPVTPGLVWFEVSVEGRATHTCLRGATMKAGGEKIGVNAIDKAILLVGALAELEREWSAGKHHPLFEPGTFAICPGVFVGAPASGLVPFAIPDVAKIEYLAWHHPDDTELDVLAEVERRVQAVAARDSWLSEHPPAVMIKHRWPQSVVAADHPIVRSVCAAHERASGEPATVAGFAAVHDATFLNAGGVPAIGYGPGDLRFAHAVDEHVELEDVLLAARTFALLAADWCGVRSRASGSAPGSKGAVRALTPQATAPITEVEGPR